MRFDSASAHPGENPFALDMIEYLFHPSSTAHMMNEYTGLTYRLNRDILITKLNPQREDFNDHLR